MGSGNRQMDVTPRVRVLLSGNGMVQVNNQNMGGDPAVNAERTLRDIDAFEVLGVRT